MVGLPSAGDHPFGTELALGCADARASRAIGIREVVVSLMSVNDTSHGGGRSVDGPTVSLGSLAGARSLSMVVWLIPWALAAAYLIVFIARLPHEVFVFGWSSDSASGFTVPATLLKSGTGGDTVLATTGSYVQIWFGLLTAHLPLHRQLWEIMPTLLFVATALVVGWSVARLAGRRAGVLAALMAFVVSPAAVVIFISPVSHNVVYPCTALLGAYLVWLSLGEGRGRAVVYGVPALAAIVLGVCLSSDLLLATTGVIPLALTAIVACLRRDRRSRVVGFTALATVVVALPVARLTSITMSSWGIKTHAPSHEVAPLSWLSLHGRLLFAGFKRLFNGYLGPGTPDTLEAALGVACVVAMVLALLALLVLGVRSLISLVWSGWRAGGATTPTELATGLHVIFWVSSALTACGAFALSVLVDSEHEAYYATAILSVAAVVPLLLRSRSPVRWLIPIGVSIYFIGSIVGLTNYDPPVVPLNHYEAQVVKLARANHATAGYAGYWDASSLTWMSHERVTSRPVFPCQNPGGANICIFPQETVASWYVPQQRHTFLLVEAKELLPPEGLGPPLKTYEFGPEVMYIYPYDIASRIGPSTG
jgi:hypothetical protein